MDNLNGIYDEEHDSHGWLEFRYCTTPWMEEVK